MKNSIIKKINYILKSSNLYFIIGIVVILAIWYITGSDENNKYFIPSVKSVIEKVIELIKDIEILKIILYTILKSVAIVFISFIISLVLSILGYKFKWFRSFISPFMIIFRTSPIASIIIILLVSVGLKLAPYYICAFVIIPVMYEQFVNTFKSINKDILEETKMISNMGLYVIWSVIIPLAVPGILTGLISVFGLGLKVLVMGEIFSASSDTFGGLLQTYRSLFDMTSIFALTLIMIILVIVFEFIIKKIEAKIKY